jgi:hypothetical protein
MADKVFKILDNTRALESREIEDTPKLLRDALLDEQGGCLKMHGDKPK